MKLGVVFGPIYICMKIPFLVTLVSKNLRNMFKVPWTVTTIFNLTNKQISDENK